MVGPFWRAVVCRVIGDSRQGDHAALKLKFDELPTTVESEIVRQVFQYQLLEGGGIHPAGRRNHASGGSHSGTEGAAHEPPVGRGPTPPRPTDPPAPHLPAPSAFHPPAAVDPGPPICAGGSSDGHVGQTEDPLHQPADTEQENERGGRQDHSAVVTGAGRPRDQGKHQRDDDDLTDLHPDVEGQKRPTITDIGTLITHSPEVRDGRPCTAGTGVTVQRIVGWYKLALSPEEVAHRIGHLTLAQVYAALAYYHANQEEMEAAMAADEAAGDRAEKEHYHARQAR